MLTWPLGVSVTSLTPRLTLDDLPLLAASQIATFEFRPEIFAGDPGGQVRAATAAMLERTGKRFVSCHIPFARVDDVSDLDEEVRLCALERLRRQLDEAMFFGSELVVLHPSTELGEDEPHRARMLQLRRSLVALQDSLRAHRVRLALEWLPRHCLGNRLEELHEMLSGLDQTLVGICLDVNHMMEAYRELPRIVEDLGDALFTLHLSDYDGIDEKHWMPGDGVIDWQGLLAALARIGYRGPFNYECRLTGTQVAERIAAFEANYAGFMNRHQA